MSLLRKLLKIPDVREIRSGLSEANRRIRDLQKGQKKKDGNLESMMQGVIQAGGKLDAATVSNANLSREIESLKILCGNIAASRVRALPAATPFKEVEFRVFSQWGEDGILQFLLAHVPVENEIFVEFGVESYREANTRFLLLNNGWKGLILDGSEDSMEAVRQSDLGWRHTLHAQSAWVTAENINGLISGAGIQGDIGILSVDIDGVDYWVWKAITVVQPRIVIVEFNALFGPDARITPPYAADFERGKAHSSQLFYGLSLAAAEALGKEKGYRLVGINQAANNAFFVREDLAGSFPMTTARELWQPSRFREARNEDGTLVYPTFEEAARMIRDCVVYDLRSGSELALKDVPDWKV